MSDASRDHDDAQARFALQARRLARRIAVLALVAAGLVVSLAAAGVILLAGLAIGLIAAAGVGVLWLLGRIGGRRPASSDPQTLEARKGPDGWTVEARRYSF